MSPQKLLSARTRTDLVQKSETAALRPADSFCLPLGEGIMINWGVDLPYDSGEVGPRARSDLPRHLGSPLTFVWWASPRAHLLTLTRPRVGIV